LLPVPYRLSSPSKPSSTNPALPNGLLSLPRRVKTRFRLPSALTTTRRSPSTSLIPAQQHHRSPKVETFCQGQNVTRMPHCAMSGLEEAHRDTFDAIIKGLTALSADIGKLEYRYVSQYCDVFPSANQDLPSQKFRRHAASRSLDWHVADLIVRADKAFLKTKKLHSNNPTLQEAASESLWRCASAFLDEQTRVLYSISNYVNAFTLKLQNRRPTDLDDIAGSLSQLLILVLNIEKSPVTPEEFRR